MATGLITEEDRFAFERLYWSELVLFETPEVEAAMVRVRAALREERANSSQLAGELEAALEAALSDLLKIGD